MTTRFPSLLTCAAIAVVAAATVVAARAPQQDARARHVYVGVTAKDAPVPGLTASDFVVREDGVAREVLGVSPAPPPTHIALLVDDSEASRNLTTELRAALDNVAADALALTPTPQIALITFGERPTRMVPYTPTGTVLDAGVKKIFPRPNSGSYFMQAVIEEAGELRKLKAERPVIIAFVNEAGPEFSNETHQRVRDALKAAGASLWTVTLQGGSIGLGSTEMRERAQVLGDVTEASGGRNHVVLSRQAIGTAMRRVLGEIAARYDVAYSRPDALIPPEKLSVEVKRNGVEVMAPEWIGGAR